MGRMPTWPLRADAAVIACFDDTGLGAVGDDTRCGCADDDGVQVAGTQVTGEGQRLA